MVKNWGAELLLIPGDFDYVDNPLAFMHQNTDILGYDFPIIAAPGNHDILKWFEPRRGYKSLLLKQIRKAGLKKHCSGDYGINSFCLIHNIIIVSSGVGTLGTNHAEYLDKILSRYSDVPFKICMWHKNQKLFQTGDKEDETGYLVYDVCRKHGAFIFTGHEHSYERTHLMDNFQYQKIHNTENVLDVRGGQTFSAVVGLGGESIRWWQDDLEKNPWWAATASASNDVNFGALLCSFQLVSKASNDKLSANCHFRDVDDRIFDNFTATVPKYPDAADHSFLLTNSVTPFHEIACKNFESFDRGGFKVYNTSLLSLQEGFRHDLDFDIGKSIGPSSKVRLEVMVYRPSLDRRISGKLIITARKKAQKHPPLLVFQGNPIDDNVDRVNPVTADIDTESGDVWISPNLLLSEDVKGDITISIEGFGFSKDVYIQGVHSNLTTCISPVLGISP